MENSIREDVMPIRTDDGNIEVHMGPSEVGAPDELRRPIVDFIKGANRSLDIAVQELDDREIALAIVEASRKPKMRVRIVLEADYMTVKKAVEDPWTPSGSNEHNREIHDALLRSAIYVRSDFNPKIFHQKFIVRDGSAVLTGSTNFTTTGVTKNLNHLIIVKSRKIANIYKKEFKEIAQGHFGALNEGHDPAPPEVTVSGIPIRVVFSPDHSPKMEIMKRMLKAQNRVDFAIFTFSKSSGIDDAMIALKDQIELRGVLDSAQGNQKWAATRPVRNAGADLRLVRKKGKLGKLHHKLMVIDDRVLVGGSFNYTGPANKLNDENVIILGDLKSASATSRAQQRRLATYARTEIDRIYDDHGSAVPR